MTIGWRDIRSLILRFAWIAISLSVFVILILFLVADTKWFIQPCIQMTFRDYQSCVALQQNLAQIGLTRSFYAVFIPLGVLFEIVPWLIVGTLIFARRSIKLYEYLFSLLFMVWGITIIDNAIINWFAVNYRPYIQFANLLNFISSSLLVMWFLFPDGKFQPAWFGWIAGLWILHTIPNSFLPSSPLNSYNWPSPFWQGINILFIGLLICSLFYRYRWRSSSIQRQQIKWVVVGTIIYSLAWIGNNIFFPFGLSPEQARVLWLPFAYGASLFFAATLGFSILRRRLWDIDFLIRRTLIYGALTITLGGMFFVLVTLLQMIFVAISHQQSAISIVISTLVLAALFNPLRTRIQGVIDRRFYRRKYDAQKILERFASSVRNEVEIEQLTNQLLSVVHETVQPKDVELWYPKWQK